MAFNQRTKIKDVLLTEPTGQTITVMGWVRTFRSNRFIALNDGSTIHNIQVVVDFENTDEALLKRITTGACLKVSGLLVASIGSGQKQDLMAQSIEMLGDCDPNKYPLQLRNRPSLEFLRENAHLRFRTNTFSAVFRVRHALAFAVHRFFNDKGFVYLHTPIITASDAEGAGETFRVTTLPMENPPLRNKNIDEVAKQFYKEILLSLEETGYSIIEIDKKIKSIDKELSLERIVLATDGTIRELRQNEDLKILNEFFDGMYKRIKPLLFRTGETSNGRPKAILPHFVSEQLNIKPTTGFDWVYPVKKNTFLKFAFYNLSPIDRLNRLSNESSLDFSSDFFSKSVNLTVSGQLEGELGAMAFGDVYTFGPTFRAENSNTARHLAEFWMIEPEMAFSDIEDNQNLAEEFIQYLIRYAMEHNAADLKFLDDRQKEEEKSLPQDKRQEMSLLEKLNFVVVNKFERITYTEAIDILLQSPAYRKKKFQYDVKWGVDLQSEHERYLVEKHFKKPVIVTGYPAAIKAFYMRLNDGCEEGKQTVAAMDILAPGIGEIVGGSQREERYDKLLKRMEEMHIPAEELWWYLDTRRFGACPHAGFGLGFERMVQFVTGMTNIRDVIAFARTPKNCEF